MDGEFVEVCGVRLLHFRDGDREYYINCFSGRVYRSLGEAVDGECFEDGDPALPGPSP